MCPFLILLRSVCRDDIALLSEGESIVASPYKHRPPDGGQPRRGDLSVVVTVRYKILNSVGVTSLIWRAHLL